MKGVMSHLRNHHNNLLHPDDRKSNEESATATATATDTDVDNADDLSFLNAVGTLSGQLTLKDSFNGTKRRAITAAITNIKIGISDKMADLTMHRGLPFTFVEDIHMQI